LQLLPFFFSGNINIIYFAGKWLLPIHFSIVNLMVIDFGILFIKYCL